jgi:hypothetical protein
MKIDLMAAFKDLFSTEGKWMTLLGVSVCMLIPIVGPMVMFGYLIRRYAKVREGKEVEDFDFNFFGDYLKIGLWPVLAVLVMSLVAMPFIFVAMLPMMFAPAFGQENEGLMIGLALIGMLVYFAVIIALTLFSYPVLLRSGLMMDFKAGFSKEFVFSFVKKVGWSLIGYYILVGLISFPLMIVGYLALIIGVYAVASIVQVAIVHLLFQHYDLYLERGGEPISVHPDVTARIGKPPLPTASSIET